MDTGKKKLWFIVNPRSGVGRQKKIGEAIRNYIDKDKFEYSIHYTEYSGHAIELARKAISEDVAVVVAVGGDGSVNEVAQCLVNTEVILGIIPMGSGNGLAHFLRLPFKPRNIIEVINKLSVTRIDTGLVNDVFFVSVAGVGFDAHVADVFAKGTKRGFFSYLKISILEYNRYKQKRYKLIINGQEYKRRAMMIVFANSDQFGYNSAIAPGADIKDGLLDICIFGKPSLLMAPWMAWLLFTGRIDKIKYSERYKASEIQLFREHDKLVNIDGEPKKIARDIKISMNPLSLKVIVPLA
jgi:YegS/Rv2252/BmrU family lipid kinase